MRRTINYLSRPNLLVTPPTRLVYFTLHAAKVAIPYVGNICQILIGPVAPKCFFFRSRRSWLLADRTNGRAIGTDYSVASVVVVVCRLWRYVLWLNVLEQKLLLTAYMKSYIRNRLVPK